MDRHSEKATVKFVFRLPSEKEYTHTMYSERKEFAPLGIKFFPFFLLDTLPEGDWCRGKE